MPSWWGKSSSKEAKKKTTTSKESFMDTLHRKFRSPSEGKVNSRSGGSRRHCSDTVSEKGSRSPTESRSPSPSKQVARCQSFADRPQPLPLPNQNLTSVGCTDSGIKLSARPICEKRTESSTFLLPKPGRSRLNPTDLDNDPVIASVSSQSSIDNDDPVDSHQRSPRATDFDNGLRATSGNPTSVMAKDQPSNFAQITPREPKKPVNLPSGNHGLSTSPKRRPLGSHVPNLLVPFNTGFCSAPDSSRSSPSRSPLRAFGSEQVVNVFRPLVGSGHCSSPGSGQNSGHNSMAMGGDMSSQLFWQQSRGSPEYSPVPSPRLNSPNSGSRIHSGAVTPIHPRLVGIVPLETQSSWPDDGKQQSHRLPLPPVTISNPASFSHTNSAAASPSVPRSPGRTENPPSPGSRWKKGKLLGRGTFGHVYVGFNSDNGDMCAMKEVTLFSDDAKSKESAKQLMQEITLLSRLRHQNIVQYYGSETVGDKLYIYLEYVSGGSIYKLLQDYGQFGELAIRSYTHQILSGLAYLHAKHTVHRDIKGANILVDPNGRVKLADFGMAKHITGQSCPLSFKGSPYWMAPEVIKNSNGRNLAVDIWSLGCTVLEMATTKPPWSQYEGVAAMFKIGNSKELPAIPDHLSQDGKDFVYKCLQRNPHQRPTAAELLEHPFVKYAAPLERSIFSPKPSDPSPAVISGGKSVGIGQARNFSLDSERLAVHSSRVLKTISHSSEIPIQRNVSCPVSPIGSPLLNSRSPQHANGRMSPSPISSPRNVSGASTPLTGGSSTIPFSHPKQLINLQPLTSLYPNGLSYHDSGPDMFRGPQAFSELANGESYDGQTILADRVSRQLLGFDNVKISPSLDLSSS